MAHRRRSNKTSLHEALNVLAELLVERAVSLNKYSVNLPRIQDDNENEDSESPILDFFDESCGAQAGHTLTNFSLIQFQGNFDRLREHIGKKIQERERKLFVVSRKGGIFYNPHCLQALSSETFFAKCLVSKDQLLSG